MIGEAWTKEQIALFDACPDVPAPQLAIALSAIGPRRTETAVASKRKDRRTATTSAHGLPMASHMAVNRYAIDPDRDATLVSRCLARGGFPRVEVRENGPVWLDASGNDWLAKSRTTRAVAGRGA